MDGKQRIIVVEGLAELAMHALITQVGPHGHGGMSDLWCAVGRRPGRVAADRNV